MIRVNPRVAASIEGFSIFVISHWLGGKYLPTRLLMIDPDLPDVTAGLISSSAVSPLIAIIYLSLRLREIPAIVLRPSIVKSLGLGVILAWLVIYVQTLFLGKEITEAQEILGVEGFYFYLTLFLLIAWGPLLEEIFMRGYYFEILRKEWGDVFALLVSSFLFVLPHWHWGQFGASLIFIFFFSILFTLVYIQGGLVAAVPTHMFVNLYLLYLNMTLQENGDKSHLIGDLLFNFALKQDLLSALIQIG